MHNLLPEIDRIRNITCNFIDAIELIIKEYKQNLTKMGQNLTQENLENLQYELVYALSQDELKEGYIIQDIDPTESSNPPLHIIFTANLPEEAAIFAVITRKLLELLKDQGPFEVAKKIWEEKFPEVPFTLTEEEFNE